MYIYNQKILVMGVLRSGLSVGEFLAQEGVPFYFYEDNDKEKAKVNIEKMISLGGKRLFSEDDFSLIDIVVLSPGIPINHSLVVTLKKQGKRIMSEIEFGFLSALPTVIAITGTNGKTTTCSLLNEIIKGAEKNCILCGNIGKTYTGFINEIERKTICVTEVSSYQLESTNKFLPHIACVLNIAPDHLERHYTMENYVFLKSKILKELTKSEYAVLNYDEKLVADMVEKTDGKAVFVSVKGKCDGVYLENENIYYFDDYVCSVNDITLLGEHNLYNVLFSVAVCKILGINNEVIIKAIGSFKGVKHRLEKVGIIDGITFINDSKATNTASTVSALKTVTRPTVLILGGSEKGESYDLLFQSIKENGFIKNVVLSGSSRNNMLSSAVKYLNSGIITCDDFDNAVKIAKTVAKEGDTVLLSPACASFDSFSCFEERGERFCSVLGLKHE